MGDLSPHFSTAEFRCDHGRLIGPPAELVWRLEDIRRRIGRPLPIVSGYRCPTCQRRVGLVRSSRHRVGDAVDVPKGLVTVDQALASGFRGVGTDGRWVVHLDCRPAKSAVIFDDLKYRRRQ